MLAAIGLGAIFSHRNTAAPARLLGDDHRGSKFRDNYDQKVKAKVRKVRRWRKRNEISRVSRAYNLKRR